MKTFFTSVLKLSLIALTIFVANSGFAQMKSPPASTEANIGDSKISINYSQPSARGREVMGGLVPYDKVWRTGANKATTIEISSDVKVEGKSLSAGKYGLFTIPGKDNWVIIFNEVWDQWGSFNYDDSKDVLRVEVESGESEEFIETFTITAGDDGFTLEWENTSVKVGIEG